MATLLTLDSSSSPSTRSYHTEASSHSLKDFIKTLKETPKTDDPPASRELLGVLEIDKLFDHLEIFPAKKFTHFKNIHKASSVDYKDMLFFDDEYRNIRDISTLGVTCFYIEDGNRLSISRLKKGLEQFSQKNSS